MGWSGMLGAVFVILRGGDRGARVRIWTWWVGVGIEARDISRETVGIVWLGRKEY